MVADDLKRLLNNVSVIGFMAWCDVRSRYKRTVLGPLWLTLGTLLGTAGLGYIWSELFRLDRSTFVPALTCGLIVWQFLSGCITEAPTTFNRQAGIIRNMDVPLSIHPVQMVTKHFINLLHTAPVFVVVAVLLAVPVGWNTLLVVPCLLLVILNLAWITFLLSILGARFRDLEYLIAAVMPLLMFLSPVMYRPNYLPISGRLLWLNPLSHLIEIVRYPLLGSAPPSFVVWTNVVMAVVGWTLVLVLFHRVHSRIAFWI
ncbi:ABC transporter permease [Paraburkholderia kirstenboschensis]|uniref:ABC transporter permease n=1 Tax=Paraburkholderia kirstenboschensis TaxID=1245436 RepID=A0ABZ0E9Z9_9BURK|nr:ABC transporter permease [Paraburkholderia kirstenboschensis]WOD14041.1 ABC transporter permease [Paraburkholderia kirstenboschensis]